MITRIGFKPRKLSLESVRLKIWRSLVQSRVAGYASTLSSVVLEKAIHHRPRNSRKISTKPSRRILWYDGRVVKAFDSKSNGIFPRRFESYLQRAIYELWKNKKNSKKDKLVLLGYPDSCDGRVIKAFDWKSNGILPRRFESYSQRLLCVFRQTGWLVLLVI